MFNLEFIGNLTKDVETKSVKTSNGDTTVAQMNVAINEGYGDKKTTTYIRATAWGKTAEACAKFLVKGKRVFISGTPKTTAYINKNQEAVPNLEVTVRDIEFLSPASENNNTQQASSVANYNKPANTTPETFTETEQDDLPF